MLDTLILQLPQVISSFFPFSILGRLSFDNRTAGHNLYWYTELDYDGRPNQIVTKRGTHLRRDTVIPQWFQASKAAAASDGHAVHF